MKNEWEHKCNHANRHKRAQSMHSFPKWQNGNRQGGKYVLKGEGERKKKRFVGWGMYFILLNQFVRFFLETRNQKRRVFPCKLPSLISLSDMLHYTTTHQRPSMRWAWGSKPGWGAEPVYPWAPWITSFTRMSNRRQGKEEHKSKDLHSLRNRRRFMPSPATPTYEPRSMISFFLFIFFSPLFHSPFCQFSGCVPFCHVRRAPAHPQLHPAAPPSSSSASSLVPTKHVSKNSCVPNILTSGRYSDMCRTASFKKVCEMYSKCLRLLYSHKNVCFVQQVNSFWCWRMLYISNLLKFNLNPLAHRKNKRYLHTAEHVEADRNINKQWFRVGWFSKKEFFKWEYGTSEGRNSNQKNILLHLKSWIHKQFNTPAQFNTLRGFADMPWHDQ